LKTEEDRLVECVPNFSEGKRPEVLVRILATIRAVPGIKILHSSMDPDHNRSVVTFVGDPEAVKEGAFQATRVAAELIDLNLHRGEHPRIGTCDVIPFIPLARIEMPDCVHMAEDVAERIWCELGIPTYLYGESARKPEHRSLSFIRRGGFEGLSQRIALPGFQPDFGSEHLHPTAGATAVGARKPLVAFNVNLQTTDLTVAKTIARAVRESAGGLPHVQAWGMALRSRGLVQVSMNLLDVKTMPMKRVFQRVVEEAAAHGIAIHSSEVIELVPLQAVIDGFADALKLQSFSRDQILEWVLKDSPSERNLTGHETENSDHRSRKNPTSSATNTGSDRGRP
jgi:glutamate formiminotransferase